jgi:phage repressor protein C with HTH and peptisase S24 domain
MNHWGERLKAAAEELGWSAAELSRRSGVPVENIKKYLQGSVDNPRGNVIAKLATALDRPEVWLSHGEAPPPSNVRGGPISVPAVNPRSVVEVLGVARGGENGWFELNGQVIDRVPLPPGISSADLIFALYISGDSMWPRYEDGDLVYIHRDRPAVNGVDVVVELRSENDGEAGRCFIKRLVKRTATHLVLRQHNPTRDIEIALPTVARVFRILTSSELMGVR